MSQTLEVLPTVEEMMIALSSPVVPDGNAMTEREIQLDEISVEDMIREMYAMIKSTGENTTVIGGTGGGGAAGTYDGI